MTGVGNCGVEEQIRRASDCLHRELKLPLCDTRVCLSRDPSGLSARCLVLTVPEWTAIELIRTDICLAVSGAQNVAGDSFVVRESLFAFNGSDTIRKKCPR